MSATDGAGTMTKDLGKSAAASGEDSPKEDGKNRGWPKGKKRYPKSPGAPKQPLSGYVHFLNFRRDAVRKEYPDLSFADISKKLAQEWSQLDGAEKQIYVKKAEEDKERYNREFAEYQQTDAYKQFMAAQKEKQDQAKQLGESGIAGSLSGSQSKKKKAASAAAAAANTIKDTKGNVTNIKMEDVEMSHSSSGSFMDIPIFREEFLDHNKTREAELKQLRKQATEFEEQNAILQKHVENMKSTILKLEQESGQQKDNNSALEKHLEALRKLVIVNFGGLTLPTPTTPGSSGVPLSLDNVDDFISQLHTLVVEKPKENESLAATVKDIARKIDYSSVSS